MKDRQVYTVVGTILAVAVVFALAGLVNQGMQEGVRQEQQVMFESKVSGTTSAGDVAIEMTPKEMSSAMLKVGISVNTHSVDLSAFDLKEITTLEYDGKRVKPSAAPSLSGHHTSGDMIFNVGQEVRSWRIIIRSIPQNDERIFEWP